MGGGCGWAALSPPPTPARSSSVRSAPTYLGTLALSPAGGLPRLRLGPRVPSTYPTCHPLLPLCAVPSCPPSPVAHPGAGSPPCRWLTTKPQVAGRGDRGLAHRIQATWPADKCLLLIPRSSHIPTCPLPAGHGRSCCMREPTFPGGCLIQSPFAPLLARTVVSPLLELFLGSFLEDESFPAGSL